MEIKKNIQYISLAFHSRLVHFLYFQDRAKIQSRRRPPSRAARKTAAAQSSDGLSDDFFGPQSPTSPTGTSAHIPPVVTSPSVNFSPPRVPSPADLADTSKSRPAVDMFGNEDLFSGDLPKSSAKSVITSSDTDTNKSSSGDIFSDNLFSGKTTKKSAKTDNLFASPGSKAKPKADSLVTDDSDIFSSVPKKTDTKTEQQHVSATKTDDSILNTRTTKPKSKHAAVADNDDLFSSPVLSNKIKDRLPKTAIADDKVNENKIQENGLPPADDVGKYAKGADLEDDIFADSSLNKKKGKIILI